MRLYNIHMDRKIESISDDGRTIQNIALTIATGHRKINT